MSSINAIPNYIAYYDLPDKGAASTGLVFAIWAIGQMVGSLFTWLCDWRGRKFMIFFGASGVLIGTIIVATAPTLPVFIGGRFILAFFATLAHLGAIIYLVEIAPTKYRGTVAGLYNTFYYFVSRAFRIKYMVLTAPGFYTCDIVCLWGPLASFSHRQPRLEAGTMAADDLPRICGLWCLVLS